jgi:hypothetical protein
MGRTITFKNCLGKTGNQIQSYELEILLYTIHKNYLKWIKDLNARGKIIRRKCKLLKESIGEISVALTLAVISGV